MPRNSKDKLVCWWCWVWETNEHWCIGVVEDAEEFWRMKNCECECQDESRRDWYRGMRENKKSGS